MATMRWISFAQSDSLHRSLVHILPTTRGGIAAQPVACVLQLFADRPDVTEISIDGMRLNQPDGIRLDEAFPRLREGGNSLVGISIVLESVQQKGDLRNSECAVEIVSRGRSIQFPMIACSDQAGMPRPLMAINDSLTQSSVIFVNQGTSYAEVRLAHSTDSNGLAMCVSLTPHSVSEYVLKPQGASLGDNSYNCGWGTVQVSRMSLVEPLSADVAGFCVYREASSKKIQSVVPL